MKKILIFLFATVFTFTVKAQEFISLWPAGKMPNSKGIKLEHIEERQRITQVAEPGFYTFLPSNEDNKGAAVLILPSGGYQKLTYDLGGFQVAKWFNSLGISAFVLIYRLPNSPDLLTGYEGPIQDAQRVIKMIRANSAKYNIDPDKIGIFGSSAGGHLATTLGTHTEDFSMLENDSLNAYSFKPDFLVLVSPVVSFKKFTHEGSLQNFLGESPSEEQIILFSNEFHVSKATPPSFLVHAQNDQAVSPMNSIMFYSAIIENGVPGSLHIFPQGEHAIGITNDSELTDEWKILCKEWLIEQRFID